MGTGAKRRPLTPVSTAGEWTAESARLVLAHVVPARSLPESGIRDGKGLQPTHTEDGDIRLALADEVRRDEPGRQSVLEYLDASHRSWVGGRRPRFDPAEELIGKQGRPLR